MATQHTPAQRTKAQAQAHLAAITQQLLESSRPYLEARAAAAQADATQAAADLVKRYPHLLSTPW